MDVQVQLGVSAQLPTKDNSQIKSIAGSYTTTPTPDDLAIHQGHLAQATFKKKKKKPTFNWSLEYPLANESSVIQLTITYKISSTFHE